jgi:Rrf2 family transcriptional regulator, iron-sulfur cluster assembly transcription factor
MLSLRKETDYALQFLQYLAKDTKKCYSLKKFAEKAGISFYFMQKIARKLTKSELIRAEQGVNGGYCLNTNPKKLTLYKVVSIMEEGIRLLPCVGDLKCECKKGRTCRVKKIMCKMNNEVIKSMQRVKIV